MTKNNKQSNTSLSELELLKASAKEHKKQGELLLQQVLSELTADQQQRLQDIPPPEFHGSKEEWDLSSIEDKLYWYLYSAKQAGITLEAFLAEVKEPMYVPPENEIGERIKLARTQLGLNVEELARLTKEYDYRESGNGISASMLRRYEYKEGGSNPGAREICLLCDALDVSADWLVRGIKKDIDELEIFDVREVLRDFIRETVNPRNALRAEAKRNLKMQKSLDREEKLQRAKLPNR